MKLAKHAPRFVAVVLAAVLCLVLGACAGKSGDASSASMKDKVIGTWNVYHLYETTEGGFDVALSDEDCFVLEMTPDSFSLTAKDGSTDPLDGTYTWRGDNEADAKLGNGSALTLRFSESDNADIDLAIVELNRVYELTAAK